MDPYKSTATETNGMRLTTPNIIWLVVDALLLVSTSAGNVLTLIAIKQTRKLAQLLSNQFLFSLALSDLMVGLTIPYHYAFTFSNMLSSSKRTCVLRFVLIIFACSNSIYNLLVIATDRYIAIVHPLQYKKYMRKKIIYGIIIFGWCLTLGFATVLLYWNKWSHGVQCTLNCIVPLEYMTYVLTPMFISVWIAILLLYIKIWRVATRHAKKLRDVVRCQNGTISRNDWKSLQVVLLILGCFSICWLPYFITITCLRILGSVSDAVYETSFTLAMANSCMNPVIYAWKNSNFRNAFWCILRCKSPNSIEQDPNYITNHTPTNGKTIPNGTCSHVPLNDLLNVIETVPNENSNNDDRQESNQESPEVTTST